MTALVLSPSAAETTRWVVGLLIPILVGAVMHSSASAGLKAVFNTVLVALDVAIVAILDSRGANFDVYVRQFIQTAVISFASYYGFWKPTTVAPKVSAATDPVSIGKK